MLLDMLEREGVFTKVEETGKVFPVSDRAIDVRDALVRILQHSGCQIRTEASVLGIGRQADGFRLDVAGDSRPICVTTVIIACGGQSYPGCGTTGDGYEWARQLGHCVVAPVPALTPIHSADLWVRELSGVTLPDAVLSVADRRLCADLAALPKKAILDVRRGSLLFTHHGLSGPVALDLSRSITRAENIGDLALLANFTPQRSGDDIATSLREEVSRDGRRQINSVLAEYVPRRIAFALLERTHIDPVRHLAELSKRQLQQVAASLTRCPIQIAGTGGFRKAEVTAGGVALDEVWSKTMESKLVPRCFFAGEVLDLDGPIGGYNFQAAFSTGWQAGSSV
jgi:hypothetical protein